MISPIIQLVDNIYIYKAEKLSVCLSVSKSMASNDFFKT